MEALNLGYVADSDEELPALSKPASVSLPAASAGTCDSTAELQHTTEKGSPCKRRRTNVGSTVDLLNDTIAEASAAQATTEKGTGVDVVPTPARARKREVQHSATKSPRKRQGPPWSDKEPEKEGVTQITHEGYTLRDLRRIISTMLPRYGHLLSQTEHASLVAFARLPLRAQQLYARLLGRKWPQWIRLEGLGAKYRELGEAEAQAAAEELAAPPPMVPWDLTALTQQPVMELPPVDVPVASQLSQAAETDWDFLTGSAGAAAATVAAAESPSPVVAPWLLDTRSETVATLLARPLDRIPGNSRSEKDSYGTLLLEAQPMAELRQFARGLGVAGTTKGRSGVKGRLVVRLCEAARQQRMLGSFGRKAGRGSSGSTEARLVAQALRSGRWVCAAPTPGRTALALLSELFHLQTSGVADSSFLVFSTRWASYSFDAGAVVPLFADRETLDSFLTARRFEASLESSQERPTQERAASDANTAESEMQRALATASENAFEAAKLQSPFRRQFTAAWCWAHALHSAVMHPIKDDEAARAAKIRQLRFLLDSGLCVSRRGRWYSELAKELARVEGAFSALEVAASGLAEGESPPLAVKITVDLTSESSQEMGQAAEKYPMLPLDVRWDLARRSRTLACRAAAQRGAVRTSRAWQRWLRETHAAQAKAVGSDDGGRWLPALVIRLLAQEAAAAGAVRCISSTAVGMPSAENTSKRRSFDGYDLAELTVEELALRYYFEEEDFTCGIHCEGALLRDLFGILLFDALFDTSVPGVFMSAFQDAPLDLGTEAFYPARIEVIERRLGWLAGLSSRELAEEVLARFSELHGTRIRGVCWERYEGSNAAFSCSSGSGSVEAAKDTGEQSTADGPRRRLQTRRSGAPPEACQLGAAAGAVGGRAMAAALRLLCEDYNSAGLPDLLVWSTAPVPRACFVEVKSERDTLSRRQRLWLTTLREAGAQAEVCHVRDEPAVD